MRVYSQVQQLFFAKNHSSSEEGAQLVIEEDDAREYFRYIDGKLHEYDLTRSSGKNIRLTQEEKEAIEEFEFMQL